MNPQLRLSSRDGADYVARLVYRGDSYGAHGRQFNSDPKTLVEFSRPRLGGDHFILALPAEELTEPERWFQTDIGALELPARQADRVRRWIVSPSSVEDAVMVLIGDDDEIQKARVALGRLQLEPHQISNAGAAVDQLRRLPPQLLIIGREIGKFDPLELVRRLRAAPETREVPIVVIGGDAAAAVAAGVSLHVPVPPDYPALVKGAAELLEFM